MTSRGFILMDIIVGSMIFLLCIATALPVITTALRVMEKSDHALSQTLSPHP